MTVKTKNLKTPLTMGTLLLTLVGLSVNFAKADPPASSGGSAVQAGSGSGNANGGRPRGGRRGRRGRVAPAAPVEEGPFQLENLPDAMAEIANAGVAEDACTVESFSTNGAHINYEQAVAGGRQCGPNRFYEWVCQNDARAQVELNRARRAHFVRDSLRVRAIIDAMPEGEERNQANTAFVQYNGQTGPTFRPFDQFLAPGPARTAYDALSNDTARAQEIHTSVAAQLSQRYQRHAQTMLDSMRAHMRDVIEQQKQAMLRGVEGRGEQVRVARDFINASFDRMRAELDRVEVDTAAGERDGLCLGDQRNTLVARPAPGQPMRVIICPASLAALDLTQDTHSRNSGELAGALATALGHSIDPCAMDSMSVGGISLAGLLDPLRSCLGTRVGVPDARNPTNVLPLFNPPAPVPNPQEYAAAMGRNTTGFATLQGAPHCPAPLTSRDLQNVARRVQNGAQGTPPNPFSADTSLAGLVRQRDQSNDAVAQFFGNQALSHYLGTDQNLRSANGPDRVARAREAFAPYCDGAYLAQSAHPNPRAMLNQIIGSDPILRSVICGGGTRNPENSLRNAENREFVREAAILAPPARGARGGAARPRASGTCNATLAQGVKNYLDGLEILRQAGRLNNNNFRAGNSVSGIGLGASSTDVEGADLGRGGANGAAGPEGLGGSGSGPRREGYGFNPIGRGQGEPPNFSGSQGEGNDRGAGNNGGGPGAVTRRPGESDEDFRARQRQAQEGSQGGAGAVTRRAGESEEDYQARLRRAQEANQGGAGAVTRRPGESEEDYQARLRRAQEANQGGAGAVTRRAGESDEDFRARQRQAQEASQGGAGAVTRRAGESDEDFRARQRQAQEASQGGAGAVTRRPGESEEDYQARLRRAQEANQGGAGAVTRRPGETDEQFQARVRQARESGQGGRGGSQIARLPNESAEEFQARVRRQRQGGQGAPDEGVELSQNGAGGRPGGTGRPNAQGEGNDGGNGGGNGGGESGSEGDPSGRGGGNSGAGGGEPGQLDTPEARALAERLTARQRQIEEAIASQQQRCRSLNFTEADVTAQACGNRNSGGGVAILSAPVQFPAEGDHGMLTQCQTRCDCESHRCYYPEAIFVGERPRPSPRFMTPPIQTAVQADIAHYMSMRGHYSEAARSCSVGAPAPSVVRDRCAHRPSGSTQNEIVQRGAPAQLIGDLTGVQFTFGCEFHCACGGVEDDQCDVAITPPNANPPYTVVNNEAVLAAINNGPNGAVPLRLPDAAQGFGLLHRPAVDSASLILEGTRPNSELPPHGGGPRPGVQNPPAGDAVAAATQNARPDQQADEGGEDPSPGSQARPAQQQAAPARVAYTAVRRNEIDIAPNGQMSRTPEGYALAQWARSRGEAHDQALRECTTRALRSGYCPTEIPEAATLGEPISITNGADASEVRNGGTFQTHVYRQFYGCEYTCARAAASGPNANRFVPQPRVRYLRERSTPPPSIDRDSADSRALARRADFVVHAPALNMACDQVAERARLAVGAPGALTQAERDVFQTNIRSRCQTGGTTRFPWVETRPRFSGFTGQASGQVVPFSCSFSQSECDCQNFTCRSGSAVLASPDDDADLTRRSASVRTAEQAREQARAAVAAQQPAARTAEPAAAGRGQSQAPVPGQRPVQGQSQAPVAGQRPVQVQSPAPVAGQRPAQVQAPAPATGQRPASGQSPAPAAGQRPAQLGPEEQPEPENSAVLNQSGASVAPRVRPVAGAAGSPTPENSQNLVQPQASARGPRPEPVAAAPARAASAQSDLTGIADEVLQRALGLCQRRTLAQGGGGETFDDYSRACRARRALPAEAATVWSTIPVSVQSGAETLNFQCGYTCQCRTGQRPDVRCTTNTDIPSGHALQRVPSQSAEQSAAAPAQAAGSNADIATRLQVASCRTVNVPRATLTTLGHACRTSRNHTLSNEQATLWLPSPIGISRERFECHMTCSCGANNRASCRFDEQSETPFRPVGGGASEALESADESAQTESPVAGSPRPVPVPAPAPVPVPGPVQIPGPVRAQGPQLLQGAAANGGVNPQFVPGGAVNSGQGPRLVQGNEANGGVRPVFVPGGATNGGPRPVFVPAGGAQTQGRQQIPVVPATPAPAAQPPAPSPAASRPLPTFAQLPPETQRIAAVSCNSFRPESSLTEPLDQACQSNADHRLTSEQSSQSWRSSNTSGRFAFQCLMACSCDRQGHARCRFNTRGNNPVRVIAASDTTANTTAGVAPREQTELSQAAQGAAHQAGAPAQAAAPAREAAPAQAAVQSAPPAAPQAQDANQSASPQAMPNLDEMAAANNCPLATSAQVRNRFAAELRTARAANQVIYGGSITVGQGANRHVCNYTFTRDVASATWSSTFIPPNARDDNLHSGCPRVSTPEIWNELQNELRALAPTELSYTKVVHRSVDRETRICRYGCERANADSSWRCRSVLPGRENR